MNADRLLAHYEKIADAPDAIGRLRRFVLDLAVRGKLTDYELKKDEVTTLGQIAEFIMGQAPPGNSYNERGEGTVFVKVGEFGERFPEHRAWTTQPLKFAREGDVLICVVGATIGKLNLGIECAIGRSVAAIRPAADVDQVFLFYSLMPFTLRLREDARGTAQGVISRPDLNKIAIWLPPLTEQRRIVAKVDELMALCDRLEAARAAREATRDRLTAASLARLNAPDPESFQADARFALDALPALTTRPDQIKRLRQTILNLAVRGKLVPQDPNDEPASELLKRIAKEKARLVKEGKAKRQNPLPEVNLDQSPFDLPVGWAWGRFPEIGIFGRGKSKHRPRNDPALFDGGEHLMIQTGDVARSQGVIETYTSKYNDFGLSQSFKWPKGTLCITIAANIADSGILSFDACFPDSVVGFIPASMFENARYFEYFVRTAKANLLEFAPATAQKNINLEILTQVLIPLPPLAEQRRIVAKVDELMSLCDRLEASLVTADETRRRLLEALLAEALAPADARELEAAE